MNSQNQQSSRSITLEVRMEALETLLRGQDETIRLQNEINQGHARAIDELSRQNLELNRQNVELNRQNVELIQQVSNLAAEVAALKQTVMIMKDYLPPGFVEEEERNAEEDGQRLNQN